MTAEETIEELLPHVWIPGLGGKKLTRDRWPMGNAQDMAVSREKTRKVSMVLTWSSCPLLPMCARPVRTTHVPAPSPCRQRGGKGEAPRMSDVKETPDTCWQGCGEATLACPTEGKCKMATPL